METTIAIDPEEKVVLYGDVRPRASEEQIIEMVHLRYGLTVTRIKSLVSYDDQNFHVKVAESVEGNPNISSVLSGGYLVKVLNSHDSQHRLTHICGQIKFSSYLVSKGFNSPDHIKNKSGDHFSLEKIACVDGDGNSVIHENIIRMLEYIEGDVLDKYLPTTPEISYEGGKFVGRYRKVLEGFTNPEIVKDDHQWNIKNASWVHDFVKQVESEENRAAAYQALDVWCKIRTMYLQLERVPVHGDLNESNIIVRHGTSNVPEFISVIDYGDAFLGARIVDLAFFVMYMMTDAKENYLEIGKRAVQGYMKHMEITEDEKKILYGCVVTRFAISLVYGWHYYLKHKDPYLLISQIGWTPLKILLAQDPEQLISDWTEENH